MYIYEYIVKREFEALLVIHFCGIRKYGAR
jgi:hypothetical protein